ncbi:MAG: hypothetical protein PHQ96_09660 [Candidatus Omnitrophica bacterium]|nr:hypothetical protein [Candidatus Omnitrophota bacterium]
MNDIKEIIKRSALKAEKWVEDNNYKGYEPFDGLSGVLRPIAFGNLLLERMLLQLVRQSPLNLRPILGIKPLDSTIARGYMAWGYCNMYRVSGEQKYKDKVNLCLEWLMENKSSGYEQYAWGKHFDFASRYGFYRAFEPILIWTALIGHAFLEAYELFKESRYLSVADSLCAWILKLPRSRTSPGFCIGYHGRDDVAHIHNSNLMGAAILARTAKYTGNEEYLAVAREAASYSCSRQLPNGAWFYGEETKNHWIDNFHTGYNLDGLKCYINYSGDKEYEGALKKGFVFYRDNFFEENGRPKYYHDKAYPIDIQCASQSIDTLTNFSQYDETALESALKVAIWTIDNMQGKESYFYYRLYPLGIKAKTPMLHWGQATTYKAMALLLSKLTAQ